MELGEEKASVLNGFLYAEETTIIKLDALKNDLTAVDFEATVCLNVCLASIP